MSVYLLHLDPPVAHASHYVGYSQERTVAHRVNQHLAGGSKASPLIIAALMQGSCVTLARAWESDEYDRAFERYLKTRDSEGRRNRCPICRAKTRQAKAKC